MAITLGGADPAFGQQLKPQLQELAGGPGRVADSFNAGVDLAGQFFNFGTLGRIGDAGPAGQVSGTPSGLTRTVSDLRQTATDAATRTADADARLGRINTFADRAIQRTPEEEEILRRREANLAGLTQEEEVLLRESGQVGLNRGLSTALRGISSRFGGATGPASALAARPTVNTFADQQRLLLNDISQTRLDRSREALGAFETSTRGLNQDLFDRGFRGSELAQVAGLGQQGFEAANLSRAQAALLGGEQFASQDALGREQFNIGQNTLARQEQFERDKFNLDKLAAEKSGQLGLIFGGGQFGAADVGRQEALAFGREGLLSAERQAALLADSNKPPKGFGGETKGITFTSEEIDAARAEEGNLGPSQAPPGFTTSGPGADDFSVRGHTADGTPYYAI